MLSRLKLNQPNLLNGLEKLFPFELKDAVREVVRRIDQNFTSLTGALRTQAVTDPDILPAMTVGDSPESNYNSATTQDTDDLWLDQVMWNP